MNKPFSLMQKELSDWQTRNFGGATTEDMALGMAEEVGELCHMILKRKQKIREGADGSNLKDEIADAVADTFVFGVQVLTCEGLDAEVAITQVFEKVLKRVWRVPAIQEEDSE